MDLKPFVGLKALVQFRPGIGYAVVTTIEGHLAPLLMKNPDGKADPVIVPYIDGMIRERRGAYVVVYGDQACSGNQLEVAIHPDAILSVTVHGEQKTAESVILVPGS